jgi:hypothetical protein
MPENHIYIYIYINPNATSNQIKYDGTTFKIIELGIDDENIKNLWNSQFIYNLNNNTYSTTTCNCQCSCTSGCTDCSSCTCCCKTCASDCVCCTTTADNIIKFCPICKKFSGNYIILNYLHKLLQSCTCKCSNCTCCIKYDLIEINKYFIKSLNQTKIKEFFEQVDENIISEFLRQFEDVFDEDESTIYFFKTFVLSSLSYDFISDIVSNIKNDDLKQIINQIFYILFDHDDSLSYLEFLQQMQVNYLSKLNYTLDKLADTIDNAIKENSKLLSNVSENTKTTAANTEKTAKNVSSVNTLVTHYVKSSNYNNYDEY